MKNLIILILIASFQLSGFAQKDLKLIRKGNSDYNNKNYKEAEINYRKSLDANNNSYKAQYNLGNALYKQKNYQEALKSYKSVAENPDFNKDIRSNAWHNIGNTLLQSSMGTDSAAQANKQENLKNSIDAYKNSLRLKPKDNDTKYNMEYAKKMLSQAQQQQQQKQDKNQQNKNQQQQQKQDNKQDKQDKQDQQQNKQNAQNKMSKQEADRMLEAMNNNEKNTRDKLKLAFPGKTKIEKDW
ncbi:MAG: tetratricopeptide repeat protein [Bacteroidota bacterium]